MSVSLEEMKAAAPGKRAEEQINQITTYVNTGQGLMDKTLFKKFSHAFQYSPIRHASQIASIATSSVDTRQDQVIAAASTYAYLGHLPALFGRQALRFVPVVGNVLLARDACDVASNILDAGAKRNIPVCVQLNKFRIASGQWVGQSFTQGVNYAKALKLPPPSSIHPDSHDPFNP